MVYGRGLLLVGNDIYAGVVEGGGLGEQRSNDGHWGGDGFGVAKGGPEAHDGVGRPGDEEHQDHHHRHLLFKKHQAKEQRKGKNNKDTVTHSSFLPEKHQKQ